MSSSQRIILGDASAISNIRTSSRTRRKSFCVSDRSSSQAETPSTTDRRALLAEWRKQSRGTSSAEAENAIRLPPSSAEHFNKKRGRLHDAPPLPPSAFSSSPGTFLAGDSISARERLKLRKQQKRLHHHVGDSPSEAVAAVTAKSTIEFFDDEEECVGGNRLIGRSPLLRKSLGGARRRSISARPCRSKVSSVGNHQVDDCE